MKYYSAIYKNETMQLAGSWTELENTNWVINSTGSFSYANPSSLILIDTFMWEWLDVGNLKGSWDRRLSRF